MTWLVFAWALVVAHSSGAQRHTDWLVSGHGSVASLARLDAAGRLSTILPPAFQLRPWIEAAVMDRNNRDYAAVVHSGPLDGHLLHVDPTGAILSSTYLPAAAPPSIGALRDLVLEPDGDWIVLEGAGRQVVSNLYRVDALRRVTTLAVLPIIDPKNLVLDIDTGDYLVHDDNSLWRVSRDGRAVNRIATFQPGLAAQMTQDLRTGDIYITNGSTRGGGLVRYDGRVGRVVLGASTYYTWSVAADRASARTPRMMVGTMPSGSVSVFSVDTQALAITTVYASTVLLPTHIRPYRGRNVATQLRAPRTWDVRLSFPGEFANGYVVLVSLSGTRPGVRLPDGRHVALNPDAVTALGLGGGLGAILQGGAGVIDANGRAQAVLAVPKAPSLAGLRVWLQAVTLSGGAPLGIATIADPVIVNVR